MQCLGSCSSYFSECVWSRSRVRRSAQTHSWADGAVIADTTCSGRRTLLSRHRWKACASGRSVARSAVARGRLCRHPERFTTRLHSHGSISDRSQVSLSRRVSTHSSPKRWSAWDDFRRPWTTRAALLDVRGLPARELRMRERTELFERSWSARESRGVGWVAPHAHLMDAGPGMPSDTVLAEEMLRRWSYWRPRLHGTPNAMRVAQVIVAFTVLAAWPAGCTLQVAAGMPRPVSVGLILGIGLTAAAIFGMSAQSMHRRLIRLRRDLEDGLCPDCGYDLSSVRPGIELGPEKNLRTGPARCPECGSPWPMLPPPVADNI